MENSTTVPAWDGGAQKPEFPRTLNLQAIDVCNSRCIMCNIWKDGVKETLSVEQLREHLRSPFYSEIAHVGVTGGEPTLRKDLVDLYTLLADCLPGLKGASFITHGMQTARAVDIYSRVHELYKRRGLDFSGMVSLDGVGEIHDKVRGRNGAFESASRTLLQLKERGVNAIAACTIVRSNVYHLHDLLEWGQENGVYVRFRVAEFIRRLYNDSCSTEIRCFTSDEERHLVCFLYLLLTEYENDETIRRTYRSILSLLTGGERLIGCPYRRGAAINMNSRGELASCAPKGETIGPATGELGELLASLNSDREIVGERHCSRCIHDYHDDWSGEARIAEERAKQCEADLYGVSDDALTTGEFPAAPFDPRFVNEILMVGWYGTETAGDIAILQGIMSEYLERNPGLRFRVMSLHPFYTRTTIAAWPKELQSKVRILDYVSVEALDAVAECDAVVMAGGPLMDIHETGRILCLFKRFSDRGKARVIEGCGVGPLHNDDYRWNVCRLARFATRIAVRDSASRDMLRSFGIQKTIEVRPDPAVTFLRSLAIRHDGSDGKVIRCFLRELTSEYPQAVTPEQARANLTTLLRNILQWYPEHRVELWSMHHFPVGKDDRLFARQLVREIGDARLTADWHPRTPREIAQAMARAEFCVCMRFHSCVFASEVGAPFLAIDYTAGGKIRGVLGDAGEERRLCTLAELADIDAETLKQKIGCEAALETRALSGPSGRPEVLHIIQSLTGGGAARAMLSVAKHSALANGPLHRVVSLRAADATGLELAKQTGVEVLDAPDRPELHRAMAEADIVLVHWWNCPEISSLFMRELPPMRLALWVHVGGFHAPYILTRPLIDFADLAVACSPHTFTHPVFEEGRRGAMVMAGAEFARLEGITPRAHEGFRVGYIGTLDPVKMHPDYVAMSCAVDVPDVKFVVCGGGDRQWLEEQTVKLGRSESFEFQGAVEDIRSVLEELDVYGYPLCAETYAAAELNLQEAMFAGLPVVAFPHGGIGQMILHGETGLLVNSAEEYARAIVSLHRDPEERRRLGRNAAAFARENWGAGKAAAGFHVQFGHMLTQPKRPRQWSTCEERLLSAPLTRELAIFPGARMFIESLGEAGHPFVSSIAGVNLEESARAEEQIGRLPLLTHYTCAHGYRERFPSDPFLQLWSGLGFLNLGKAHDAYEAFERAINLGLTHWRLTWYLALAAEKAGKTAEAANASRAIIRVMPGFAPAREMQARLNSGSTAAVSANAQRLVQEAQLLLRAGDSANARVLLARASALIPDQVVLMELEADLDCRLGALASARDLHDRILKIAPDRRSARLDAIQAALRASSVRTGARVGTGSGYKANVG